MDVFCREDYWLDTRQPWFEGHPLGKHGMARVSALGGKLFADWAVDEQLTKSLVAENQGFAGYADPKYLNDVLCRMSVGEVKAITLEERKQLLTFYSRYFGQ